MQHAMMLVDSMVAEGVAPDDATWSVLLEGAHVLQHSSLQEAVRNCMLTPTQWHYWTLAEALCPRHLVAGMCACRDRRMLLRAHACRERANAWPLQVEERRAGSRELWQELALSFSYAASEDDDEEPS